MKQVLVLAALAILGLAQVSDANCNRRCYRGGCDSGAPCGPVTTVAAQPAPAPKFEDRKVIRYKQVMKEKEIEVLECRRVTNQEKYTYTVCVPVTTQEKRKVTVCTPVYKDVPYTYTACVPVTVQEKRRVVEYTPTYKDVDRTWTEIVRTVVPKKVTVTNYQCIRENVTETVPVCRVVRVNCVDECGRCFSRLERVTTMETVTRCVVKRVPVTQDVVVNEVVCTPVQKSGKVKVCEMVRSERDVMVNVCRMETVQKQGVRRVCEMVRSEKDVLVNVCNFKNEQREGVRLVCSTVTEKVKRKVLVCETVQYEETIRVQVGGFAPCASDCNSGCGSSRGVFFRRGGCCN